MLSCRILPVDAAPDQACCRLAPFHQTEGISRARRYPSDTTDAQWAVIDPLLPDPAWLAGKGGRREVHCRREIVDAIFYVVDNGIKWRALPADFPPWSTVYNYFAAWEAAGITQDMLDGLRDRVRIAEGRTAAPSAAVIDSASVKAAETVGKPSRGYDAGKDQRPETPHRRGHPGPAAVRPGHRCLGTRPRWRQATAPPTHHLVSAHPPGVGRRRLRRQAGGLGRAPSPEAADREAIRRRHRIHCPAPALGRGTDTGLDRPTPPLRP